jgi:DNA-binding CsgD family transcriptional regulator
MRQDAQDLASLGAWDRAYECLAAAERRSTLDGAGLELMATAAYMGGRDEEFALVLSRAFDAFIADGATLRAARAAFWIGLTFVFSGEMGRGGGWLARSRRLVEEHGAACAEQGYLLLPRVEASFGEGDLTAAERIASEAVAIGARFGDVDLVALARHLVGRARMSMGSVREGLELLDETMVAATEGKLAPIVTGLIYCSVIETCQKFQIYDRASEWTSALSDWCDRQAELVAFTGRCLIHRAEVMIFDGNWQDAVEEAALACKRLVAGGAGRFAGPAHYQAGEGLRLKGKYDLADESYRAAGGLGFNPQPGLALMLMSQGKSQSAWAGIRRSLAASDDPLGRIRTLPAAVEIALAVGETALAVAYAEELSGISARFPSRAGQAASAEALGDVHLAGGEAGLALRDYGRAADLWQAMGAPYQAARLRYKTGLTCDKLGDLDGALRELEAARAGFEALGAEPDRRAALRALDQIGRPQAALLTRRQMEVLKLVARGYTNREIAERLAISERTVDRHVSDMLSRINAPTRAAASAFAVGHGLISLKDIG